MFGAMLFAFPSHGYVRRAPLSRRRLNNACLPKGGSERLLCWVRGLLHLLPCP